MSPKGLPDKATTAELLAWINDFRKELGRPPVAAIVRGHRGSACHCPVARTVVFGGDAAVIVGHVYTTVYGKRCPVTRNVPALVSDFISAFDEGRYPGLELPA